MDTNNILQEHCWDGKGWYTGALGGKNIKVDYRSKIGACTWSTTPSIRVYYQEPGNEAIKEVCWDGNGWTTGATLPNAQLGSSLAAIQFQKSGTHLRVYYQDRANTVREHCWDGSWTAGMHMLYPASVTSHYANHLLVHVIGTTLGEYPAGTAICGIAWGSDPQVRIYLEKKSGGTVVEMAYSGGWSGPKDITGCIADSTLSVCCWGNIQIRFNYQKDPNQIHEYCWNKGWVSGATIPTK